MTIPKPLIIEYVCTGNNGRSPMAEVIALDYVHRRELANRVQVCSSGSGLHYRTKKEGEGKRQATLDIVELALKNGIYQEEWRREQARLISTRRNTDILYDNVHDSIHYDRDLVDELADYAVRMEGIFRDQALLKVGLVAAGKYHQPTLPQRRSDQQRVILTMSEANVDQVRDIYTNVLPYPLTPTVLATLNKYAGLVGDVPNPFCQLLPAYQRVRDHLLIAVPKTIDRAVEEFLKTKP